MGCRVWWRWVVVLGVLGACDEETAAWIRRWREGGHRCEKNATFCRWLASAGEIDVGGEFEIRQTGLARVGPSPVAPTLAVRSSRDGAVRTFSPHGTASLCAYREGGVLGGDTRKRQSGVVALVAASSLPYLFKQWAAAVNKAAIFRAMRLDWALWIGDLDPRLAETTSPACERREALAKRTKPSPNGSLYVGDLTRATGNHLVKVVAAYALLERPRLTGVCYVDIDAMISRKFIVARAALAGVDDAKRTNVFRDGERGAAVTSSWWSLGPRPLDRPMWRTKSLRFYVKARDPVAFKLLGLWIFHRCGFKDQLPLWHTLLSVADEKKCLRGNYDGRLYSTLSYRQAFSYPGKVAAASRPPHDEDPLLTSCREVRDRCPDLAICDDDVRLLYDFYHASVPTDRERTFEYDDDAGKRRALAIPNSLFDYREVDGCRRVADCEDEVFHTLRTNADFVDYFGLDLAHEAALPPAYGDATSNGTWLQAGLGSIAHEAALPPAYGDATSNGTWLQAGLGSIFTAALVFLKRLV